VKAMLVNKLLPIEEVSFDFNPEKLTFARVASTSNNPQGGGGGSTPSIFRGAAPRTLSGTAHLEGSGVKDRAEQLMSWMDPGGGLLGKAIGAALGALSGGRINLASKPPVLLFLWGPFLMECVLTRCSVDFTRFDSSGDPTRATVTFTVKEEPSLLSLLPTNPTSGGLPGRQRHVVSQGENLQAIATRAYGQPAAWRAVAEANGIDDPLRVRPGDTVYLPNPNELARGR